jgi:hypothetical protein
MVGGCSDHKEELASTESALTMTLNPTADAEVRSGTDAASNFGTATFLSVYTPAAGVEARTYLAFDASSLPAGATVTSAKLRIYVTNETTNGPTVRLSNAAFTESTITWNNQPGYGATVYGDLGSAPTLNTWYEIPLDPSVVADGVFYLALIGDTNDAIRMDSREGVNKPQLVIDYEQTTSMTFHPIADAEVRPDLLEPAGTGTFLSMYLPTGGSEARSYLTFDTSALPDGATITSAKLRFYVYNETDNGPTVHMANGSFDEASVMWDDQPGYSATVYGDAGAVPATDVWMEIPLSTGLVGDGVVNMALVPDSADALRVMSRETATPPELVVTYSGGDGGGSGSGSGSGGGGPVAAAAHLEADAISTSEIDVGWDAPAGAVDGYKVYRDGSLIGTVTQTSYQDTGLAMNSTHSYKVVAYSGSTDAPDSNTDSATTHLADANSSGNGFGYTSSKLTTTFNSLGVEVNITGDGNYTTSNRTAATMVYRVQGTGRWHRAFAPLRISYRGANQVNGSILYLAPGTTYDVSIYLSDIDGGAKTITTTATTWASPVLPACTKYVAATGTSGDGSLASPYVGIATADAAATPGTVFCLRGGTYTGTPTLTHGGNATQGHVVWRAYQTEQPTISQLTIGASYVWLDGLYFRNPPQDGDSKFIRQGSGGFTDVRITHCDLAGANHSIRLSDGTGARWYVADNTIVGIHSPSETQWNGEGIDLQNTPNSVVAHNKITNAADAISQPGPDSDVFGNDISDCSDDGIETDDGGNNVRVWGNRIANVNNGFSFQYMHGAPWYFTRNQFINSKQNPLKLRAKEVCSDDDVAAQLCSPANYTEVVTETVDRFVFVHNTIVDTVSSGYVQDGKGYLMLRGIMKNNLWVAADGSNGSARMWDLADYHNGNGVNWRTDVDYDGFDFGATTRTDAFHYTGGGSYSTLSALTAALGIESHGRNFVKELCFSSFNVPSAAPASVPVQVLTLNSSCSAAVDQGLPLANLNDGYQYAGPDLGAFEVGAPVPTFGPR